MYAIFQPLQGTSVQMLNCNDANSIARLGLAGLEVVDLDLFVLSSFNIQTPELKCGSFFGAA